MRQLLSKAPKDHLGQPLLTKNLGVKQWVCYYFFYYFFLILTLDSIIQYIITLYPSMPVSLTEKHHIHFIYQA